MPKWLKILMFSLFTLSALNVGIIIGATVSDIRNKNVITVQYLSPYCPAEDSCQPMYENGQWFIKEIVP